MHVILDHDRATLLHGDCRQLLETIPEESVDSIVTDPPYLLANASGTGFMGREWDSVKLKPGETVGTASEGWHRTWAAIALRALKPGGYLLAFGGSRTFHRMCSAAEDVGFELRDVMMWLYGSGFPKSLNFHKVDGIDPVQWRGWGTALKPAYEPIMVARKPLIGTVAKNVNAHGVGGINIGGCRIGDEVRYNPPAANKPGGTSYNMSVVGMPEDAEGTTAVGRWPANVILSHHDECEEIGTEYSCHPDCPVHILDEQGGEGTGAHGRKGGQPRKLGLKKDADGVTTDLVRSIGGPSRFFYCAKAAKTEKEAGLDHLPVKSGSEITGREEGSAGIKNPRAGAGAKSGARNSHVTVKPVALMRYLCRLVTPPGGTLLDVFAGSGTTGVAALAEGFNFIGCELGGDNNEHLPILLGRIRHALGLPPVEIVEPAA